MTLEDQFQHLVGLHSATVYRFSESIVRNAADAADVTQEAFIRLWNHLPRIHPSAVRSWLLRTARNLCLDRIRRRRPLHPIDADLPDCPGMPAPPADPHPDPAESADAECTRAQIMEAIEDLPEKWKSVFMLRELDGCSHREIARICGFPVNSVKVYLLRARQRLRASLQSLQPQPAHE